MDEAQTIATRRKRQTKISQDGKRAPDPPRKGGGINDDLRFERCSKRPN